MNASTSEVAKVKRLSLLLGAAFGLALIVASTWMALDWRGNRAPHAEKYIPGPATVRASSEATQSSTTQERLHQEDHSGPSSKLPGNSSESISTPVEITEAESEELQAQADKLMTQNGYVDWLETHPDYLAYDDETLKKLANGGDPLAQTWMAMKMTESDPVAAIELYRQAGIRGSSFALLQIAHIERRLAKETSTTEENHQGDEPDDTKRHLSEAVAWGMVALARGDHVAISFLEDLSPRDNLSSAELETACKKFNQYYSDLAQVRIQLGLNEFENTASPLVATEYAAAASVCGRWPVPMPTCRAVTRDGQRIGYRCDTQS